MRAHDQFAISASPSVASAAMILRRRATSRRGCDAGTDSCRSGSSTALGIARPARASGVDPAGAILPVERIGQRRQACIASAKVRMPLSRSFGTSARKMRAVVSASPSAECRSVISTPSQAASVRANSRRGPARRAGQEAGCRGVRGCSKAMPARSHSCACRIARSKPIVCPITTASPMNAELRPRLRKYGRVRHLRIVDAVDRGRDGRDRSPPD